MKLPPMQFSGVESSGTAPDQSAKTRVAYNTLAQGLNDTAYAISALERQRLDDQQDEVAHNYQIDKLNFEAEHYTREGYSPDDPAIQGLDGIRTVETKFENGQEVEVPRAMIPADEVWPSLFKRYNEQSVKSFGSQVESEKRRIKFTQAAQEQNAQEYLNVSIKTAEMQQARASKVRDHQINQLRILGTPDALAQIDNIIANVKDPDEKAMREEWWGPTKEVDSNIVQIEAAVQTRNSKALMDGWQKYLGYANGSLEYNGSLNKEELEQQAHKWYSHMQMVESWNKSDTKIFKADALHRLSRLELVAGKGYPLNDNDTQALMDDFAQMQAADPDNETVAKALYRLSDAVTANVIARDMLTAPSEGPDDTLGARINQARQGISTSGMVTGDNPSGPTGMDVEQAATLSEAIDIAQAAQVAINKDPMQTLSNMGFATNPEFPIEPVDFTDFASLPEQLTSREAAYDYYRTQFNYGGHLLTKNEQTEFMGVLTDESIPDQAKVQFMYSASTGLQRRHEQFWGPFITDKETGQYGAIGLMMNDYEEMGAGSLGQQIALKVFRGNEMNRKEPALYGDEYMDIRQKATDAFGYSYLGIPGVRDNYIDMATAYTLATSTKKNIKKADVLASLEKVTGGLIESGKGKFLTPAIGLDQRGWDEWINEVDASYIPEGATLGLTSEQVVEGLRSGELSLMPTSRNRQSFTITRNGSDRIKDTRDGNDYIFKYDPKAPKRYVKQQGRFDLSP